MRCKEKRMNNRPAEGSFIKERDACMSDWTISPEELGRRIVAARKAQNLSQEAVATHLGLSRPTYIGMEKGTRLPKPDELVRVAELTHRPLHWFMGKSTQLVEFSPRLRATDAAQVETEKMTSDIETFWNLCNDYTALEKIANASLPSPRNPDYSGIIATAPVNTAAAQTAQRERQRLELGNSPIPNIMPVLEEAYGLRVFVFPLLEFRIAGMFAYDDMMGGAILVNGTHPATRQKWTMAHELAHYLADRNHQEVTVLMDGGRKTKSEQFADQFATEFLMPRGELERRFWTVVQANKDFKESDLCLLADQYGVSVQAMTYRLEYLRCLPPNTADKLKAHRVQKTKKDMGMMTPEKTRFRLPDRYCHLAVRAYEREEITEGRLAEFLRCSRIEAREIVEALSSSNEIDNSGEPYLWEMDLEKSLIGGGDVNGALEGE